MSSFDSYGRVKTLFVLGITASAVTSGGLLATSFMHVPGYVQNSNEEVLLNQWQTMGTIGKAVVPPLALIATGANFLNSYFTHTQPQHYRFMAAGALSLAILPYTFLSLDSTNAELASRVEKKQGGSDLTLRNLSVKELIKRWGTRSAIRGVLLLASALISCDAMLHLSF
ncbi:hypothetical protein A1O1_09092 [Capronia coronata CBS 617.96]|uniref:Uncharacterized protein n=1 Tax=Capronia coronata CBS 617.96 TaxID=1182541 RepID=W9XMY3_9EURO|nr:uncharacterized protein A1O1_09092 [Capronia coronata CBS 617.96]EXJ78690.1 hypothetical protein A1O1_09092 [Capronia coronata CBS 617.96]